MPLSSERYYTGSITPASGAPVYLSSDMSDTGAPARIEVSGDDQFADSYGEVITAASDGALHSQGVAVGVVGVAFEVKILFCPAALYSALVTAIAATRGTSATVRVRLSSVKREIDVQAKANGNGWLSTGKFSGSVIQDVTLRLISTAAGGS